MTNDPFPTLKWKDTCRAGALFGLGLFLLESWLILRQNMVGVRLADQGAAAMLAQFVTSALLGLFSRILIVYLAGGAVLGLVAGALSSVWRVNRPWKLWWVWGIELSAVFFMVGLWKAVHRPALVDDVVSEPVLRWLLDHATPEHAWVAGALWFLVHAPFFWMRSARKPVLVAGGVLGLLAVGAWRLGLGEQPRHVRSNPRSEVRSGKGQQVVLIGVDAFRPDRLSRLDVAPNIAALAQDSTVFNRAYTPIAQTEPAWRSLLTARWPPSTGTRYPLTPERLWTKLPTLAGHLEAAGFATTYATDCSRFHYEPQSSQFAERLQPPRGALNFLLEKLRYRTLGLFADHTLGAWALPEFMDNRAMAGVHNPIAYVERLANHWRRASEQPRSFLSFHATAAHFPGDPVFPFYRKFVSADEPPHRRTRMHYAAVGADGVNGWNRTGSEGLYDELLAQADAQVGVLVNGLKRDGLYDDALIIVFSDHGESFHEGHPKLAGAMPVHGVRLSDDENRILLLIKWPRALGLAPGEQNALVRLIDIAPTVLDVVGAQPLPNAEGVSLLPLVRGETVPPLWLYAETGYTHVAPNALVPNHRSGALRTLDAYSVLSDGVVEVKESVHRDILADKDEGAFDGKGWWIRRPLANGQVEESCVGECSVELQDWLTGVRRAEMSAK